MHSKWLFKWFSIVVFVSIKLAPVQIFCLLKIKVPYKRIYIHTLKTRIYRLS